MTAYDEVPYDCQPIPCTAPEQLAVASLLHGGPCPPVHGARVLEIGCGDGANLLPLAFHRPDCRFVGVDDSKRQIEDARASVRKLGLENLELHAADVTRIGEALPTFDYVVAHGVLSWVSDAVRDGILAFCAEKLAPNGLVYLSYNTYPGWLGRGLVRRLMRDASGGIDSLRERAREGIARADALRLPLEEIEHPYAQLMSRELARVHHVGEACRIHDYLSEHNRAYWFRELASKAAASGLHYLVEAAFTQPDYRVPDDLRECAASVTSDPLEIEELVDVLWYRQHRASLFCRLPEAERQDPDAFEPEPLFVASGLRAVSLPVSLDPDVVVTFGGYFEPDFQVEITDPATRAALLALAPHWPRGLAWEQLRASVEDTLKQDDRVDLWGPLRELHALGQAELRLVDLPAPREPGGSPRATALTRWEAERRGVVTTATHQRLALSDGDREIVRRLDGRLPREALVAAGAGDCLARLGAWGLVA